MIESGDELMDLDPNRLRKYYLSSIADMSVPKVLQIQSNTFPISIYRCEGTKYGNEYYYKPFADMFDDEGHNNIPENGSFLAHWKTAAGLSVHVLVRIFRQLNDNTGTKRYGKQLIALILTELNYHRAITPDITMEAKILQPVLGGYETLGHLSINFKKIRLKKSRWLKNPDTYKSLSLDYFLPEMVSRCIRWL